jgi:hypothetical protein
VGCGASDGDPSPATGRRADRRRGRRLPADRAGEQPAGSLTGTVEHADGHRTRFNRVQLPPYKGERSVAGTEFVAAQAPDPAGGTPWGFIGTRGTDGGLCLNNPGFLVGTRLGHVQDILGVFFSTGLAFLSRCGREPTRGYPMPIDTLIAGGIPDDSAGRIERRVLSNRIVFWGRVYKDVVSVTIRTPRDVRTLVPSSRAHAILAVYDGRFPGGNVTATARLEDGREVTRTLYSE